MGGGISKRSKSSKIKKDKRPQNIPGFDEFIEINQKNRIIQMQKYKNESQLKKTLYGNAMSS
jgi:hypothetical protein